MGLFKKRVNYKESVDSSLVLASIGGDRDAFGEIVGRYQSLLCSLAYSSVGDLKHSEDIAQETFVDAWRKLDTLNDPAKLKAWLCGILRFKISRYWRKEAPYTTQGVEELYDHEAQPGRIDDAVIQEQEQALLWKTLQQLPETYREPLILYYREEQSIERVAVELELSEEAVKQRLSRGRKALQKAMATFVQDTLAKSKPGASFTMGVLLAISTLSAPKAKAALFSVGAAHTGNVIKWGSLLTILASFSGVIGSFFSVRASLAQSRTERERQATIKIVALYFLVAIVYVVGIFMMKYAALASTDYRGLFAISSQLLVLGFIVAYLWLLAHMLAAQPLLRAQERLRMPEAFLSEYDQVNSKQREYISRYSLLGIPLVHFKLGLAEQGEKPALAWIAGGDRAYGLVFAWGGLAIAPISVGIVSVGVVTVGALGLGILAVGTVAIGFIGFGASSIAYKAFGSLSALGWESAVSGGFAIAKEAALAPLPFARIVNNDQAADIANLAAINQGHLWVLGAISVLVIAPAVWHSTMVRKRMSTEQHINADLDRERSGK